ncbi:MAG: RHS repeat-associated core domain-containing protein, partial [Candidatus Korobacteraceae bacterium]
ADWLGSERMASTASRGVYYDGAYAPFGENYAETGTTDRSFTGQTQDTVSGLYDFLFRQQSSAQGRWLVPDPAGLAAVDLTNPQTWNRYAYVGNQPLSYIDPLGLKLRICGDQNHCPVSYTDAGAIGFWGGDNFWVSGDPREEPVGITVGLGVIFAGTGTYNDIRHIGGGSPEQYLCNKALATAKANSVAVTNAVNNWSVLANATQATGNVSITPYLLAAIGIRETGFRNVAQTGGGPGYGVFQITTGPSTGVTPSMAGNVPWAANYAANLLSSNMTTLANNFPNFTSNQLLQATAASYNFGTSNISGNPNTIDVDTTNGNYGSNVVQIAHNCF